MKVIENRFEKHPPDGVWRFDCYSCASTLELTVEDFASHQELVVADNKPQFIWVGEYICPCCKQKVSVTAETMYKHYIPKEDYDNEETH